MRPTRPLGNPRGNIGVATFRSRHGGRAGSTLMEAVIAITLSATLITVAVGWIHQSFKLSSLMKQRQNHHQLLMRLARQFRSDVHQADEVMLESDQRLVLNLPENTRVTYDLTDHKVVRSSQRPADEAAESEIDADAGKPRHEVFALMIGSEVQWNDVEAPNWMTMSVHRSRGVAAPPPTSPSSDSSQANSVTPTDLHVRAAIGRSRIITREEDPIDE